MAVTPQITLNAKLQDLSGDSAGSTANPAILRIALAGFGLTLPCIPGTSNVAQPGPEDYLDSGTGAQAKLWGNDVIFPAGTYYAITLLDGDGNVLQTGRYRFTGTQTLDLSEAPQLVDGANALIGAVPNGAYPGNTYTVPLPAYGGTVPSALYYNGGLQDLEEFTLAGETLFLNFETFPGDKLFLSYGAVSPAGLPMQAYVAIANGVYPGTVYTLPTPPPNAQLIGIFLNGGFQPPYDATHAPTGYTIADQQVLTMGFETADGDQIQALYMVTPFTVAGGFCAGATPGTSFTLPTMPTAAAQGQLIGLYTVFNSFLRPGIDYTFTGTAVTIKFTIEAGDAVYAYYI
jgi:hypothetical protein